MPKLKVLLACEKVIFDVDGPVSLLSIFQRMNIQLTGAPLPEKAISPTAWYVFTLWESDPNEVNQEFTQVTQVIAPDGSIFAETKSGFKNTSTDETQVKTKILIPGLPIWKEGTVTVVAGLDGDEASKLDYKFEVRYLPVPQPPIAPVNE